MQRENRTVGVVDEVLGRPPEQRVVVRVRSAAELRARDHYLPYRFSEGTGLKVVVGQGEPLADGAVVEAGFVAPSPQASAAGRDIDESSEAHDDRLGASPPAAAAAEGPFGPSNGRWNDGAPSADVGRLRLEPERFKAISPAVARRPLDFARRARAMAPAEATAFIETEGDALVAELMREETEAKRRGELEAMREARVLRIRSRRLVLRLLQEAQRNLR